MENIGNRKISLFCIEAVPQLFFFETLGRDCLLVQVQAFELLIVIFRFMNLVWHSRYPRMVLEQIWKNRLGHTPVYTLFTSKSTTLTENSSKTHQGVPESL